jgi:hypothetical protein
MEDSGSHREPPDRTSTMILTSKTSHVMKLTWREDEKDKTREKKSSGFGESGESEFSP